MKSNQQEECLHLRRATREDEDMVFRWRNDPYLIARGSSQRAVSWDEHQKWFQEQGLNDRRVMFIIQKGNLPMGQIRFDRLNQLSCVVSVYLLEEFTRKGYGVLAIQYGCREIFSLWDIQEVIACVRRDNAEARHAFIKAGFLDADRNIDGLEFHYTMTLPRFNAEQHLKEKNVHG